MSCAAETWGCREGGDCKGGRGYKREGLQGWEELREEGLRGREGLLGKAWLQG